MATRPFEQLSPAYRRRIERALAKGKTRQAARGHKAAEHIERRERERERNAGITYDQERSIRRWYENEWDPHGHKVFPEVETIVEFAQTEGWDQYQQYKREWGKARRRYLREGETGEGEAYLAMITASAGAPEMSWLYYH